MNQNKLSNELLCLDLMHRLCQTISTSSRKQVDYLRYGAKTAIEQDLGKHILALATSELTENQLMALEAAFCQVQEHLLAGLFALIDGSAQPSGWPEEIRLMNSDTGEPICPNGLEWTFGLALIESK